jgi:hypothetical protein
MRDELMSREREREKRARGGAREGYVVSLLLYLGFAAIERRETGNFDNERCSLLSDITTLLNTDVNNPASLFNLLMMNSNQTSPKSTQSNNSRYPIQKHIFTSIGYSYAC